MVVLECQHVFGVDLLLADRIADGRCGKSLLEECHSLLIVKGPKSGPQHLREAHHLVVGELSFEVEQEPAVAEEEVKCARLAQVVVQFGVVGAQRAAQMAELDAHRPTVPPEVIAHALHEAAESEVGPGFSLHDVQKWREEVAHTLAVAH